MVSQFILFLFGFALAGSDIMASTLPSLENSIKHSNLEQLTTLIEKNSKFLEDLSSKRYTSNLFKLAVKD